MDHNFSNKDVDDQSKGLVHGGYSNSGALLIIVIMASSDIIAASSDVIAASSDVIAANANQVRLPLLCHVLLHNFLFHLRTPGHKFWRAPR